MSLGTLPSFPALPEGMLCTVDAADLLQELRTHSGPMSLSEVASTMKISPRCARSLAAATTASGALREVIGQKRIAPQAAGLLAQIERLNERAGLRLASAYVRREQSTKDLVRILEMLVAAVPRSSSSRSGGGPR